MCLDAIVFHDVITETEIKFTIEIAKITLKKLDWLRQAYPRSTCKVELLLAELLSS